MTFFWLKQTFFALRQDFLYSGVTWKIKTLILVSFILLFSFIADFFVQVGNVINNESVKYHTNMTTQVMQSIDHPLQEEYKHWTSQHVLNSQSLLNSSLADRFFNHIRRASPPEPTQFQTVEERQQFLVAQAKRQVQGTIIVFADNPSAWPGNSRELTEQAFGPITQISETDFLAHHRKDDDAVFVGFKDSDGPVWWVWRDATFEAEEQHSVKLMTSFITALGSVEQEHQMFLLRQSDEYQQASSWDKPKQLVTYQPIDVRYFSLVVVFLLFAIPSSMSAAQALSWDVHRNKGVYEPLSSVEAPMWCIILKESLSRFWMMLFLFVCVGFFVGLSTDRNLYYLLCVGVMMFLGVSLTFLILQINMFFMILFQSPMGRGFARLLMLPAIVLPYNIFRVFALVEVPQIFSGQDIQTFNVSWYFGLGVICLVASIGLMLITSYRVGRYRQGLAVV